MLPERSREIQQVSPSLAQRLRCPARVAFGQMRQGTGGPAAASASALLGQAAHRALELIVDGTAVAQAWATTCDELAEKGADPRGLSGARRTELRLERRAPSLLDLIGDLRPAQVLTERSVSSADGVLTGIVDLLLVLDASVVVVDHKTGLVVESGIVAEAYEQQLRLYAAMAAESFDRPVERAVLVSLRQGVVDVDVSPEALAAAVRDVRAALEGFNGRTPDAQPALPSADHCSYCPYRPECDGFWATVDPSWEASVGVCVRGEVHRVEGSASGQVALELEVDDGSHVQGGRVAVTGLDGSQLEVATGMKAGLVDLRTRGDERVLVATARTLARAW